MLPKAILFDLDGTLLPLCQDEFVKEYFRRLTAAMSPRGYDPSRLKEAIWAGIHVMEKNDGSRPNETIFWETFRQVFGRDVTGDKPYFDDFYRGDFQNVKDVVCKTNPEAVALVHRLREAGIPVVLATNPVFPAVATESRIRWAGLTPADFTLYTTYENIGFCKPNPGYYREIARRIGVNPGDCLMVGKDIRDDMSAADVGMDVFFLSDYPVNRACADVTKYKQGGFAQLTAFLFGE